MNLSNLYKVVDTVVSLLDIKKEEARGQEPSSLTPTSPPTFADQVEARLTNVVVAALKEAFDRDRARMELERAHLDEQRRRAEESMRLEVHRQAVDREIGRLRFLAGTALGGWAASLVLFVVRSPQLSGSSRAVLVAGCALLLVAIGLALTAQSSIGARDSESAASLKTATGTASLWLLLAGLGLAAGSVLLL